MTTAVDTNVLLDILLPDPTFGTASAAALRAALMAGRVVVCDLVWAEVVSAFPTASQGAEAFNELGIEYDAAGPAAATAAGSSLRQYRRRGGKRTRLVPDFLIGAHATHQADCLLTRDRGFYRTYFPDLRVQAP